MRIGVTGGRDFDDWTLVQHTLRQMPADATLVHGGAKGADSLCAAFWKDIHGRPIESHPANWSLHGKAAGPIRNQEMVNSGLQLLIVFPGGRGTADMRHRAELVGIPILVAAAKEIPLPTGP